MKALIYLEELLRGKKPDLPRYGLVKNYYKEAKASKVEENNLNQGESGI